MGEIQFAEPIIHRLQSFLTGKEAARTAILSKSWHSAWLTRPNLDFDDTYFNVRHYRNNDHSSVDKFRKYAKRTIKRYEQSNLKIESFNLCMELNQYGRTSLANKLIVKALRIGATRLCLRLKRSNSFVLPNEVFGADNLVELSVSGGTIKLDNRVVIKCRKLKSLNIHDDVHISIDTLCKIISSCKSIENLSLFPSMIPDELRNDYGRRDNNANAGMAVGVVDNLIPRLRCLVLSYESFKALYLGDLLSRFTFLKDFTLHTSVDTILEEGIQISNCSLESIKLAMKGRQFYYHEDHEVMRPRVKFNVPSVRNFTYEGSVIPSLSFMSTPLSREWESHVSIKHHEDGFSAVWFNELSELLTQLSQSKTHLSLDVRHNTSSFDYKVWDKIIQGLRKHELENLTIDMMNLPSFSCYALFDGLFRLCRPRLITQYYADHPDQRRDNYPTNIDFLCQTLEQGVHLKESSPTQFMYGLNELVEVNAQAFDMDEWKPIPFESLLDADAPDEHVQAKQRIRLLLKWKPS